MTMAPAHHLAARQLAGRYPAGRYLIVSGACMATHILIMIATDRTGAGFAAGVTLSFCVVVVLGYLLHSRYTFVVARDAGSFARYGLAMAAALPMSVGLLYLLFRVFGWPMPVAAPAATLAMLAVNYLTSRWAILSRAAPLKGRS